MPIYEYLCECGQNFQIKQNFDELGEIKIYPEKTKITDVKESCIGSGVLIYEGRIDEDKVLFTAEDVY